jgi:hypothetical protein
MWVDSDLNSYQEFGAILDNILKNRYNQIVNHDFPEMTNTELAQNLEEYVKYLKRRFLKTLRTTVTDSVEDPTVINQEDQKVVSDLDKQILETYK